MKTSSQNIFFSTAQSGILSFIAPFHLLVSAVSEEQWRSTEDFERQVSHIRSPVVAIGERLVSQFNGPSRQLGIAAGELEDDNSLSLTTLIGDARLTLRWEADGDNPVGIWVAQRRCRDTLDRLVWEDVWELRIPASEHPYVLGPGVDERANLLSSRRFASNADDIAWVSAQMIAYCVI